MGNSRKQCCRGLNIVFLGSFQVNNHRALCAWVDLCSSFFLCKVWMEGRSRLSLQVFKKRQRGLLAGSCPKLGSDKRITKWTWTSLKWNSQVWLGRVLCSCSCDLVNDRGLSVAWAEVEVEPAPLVSPYALSLEIKGPLTSDTLKYLCSCWGSWEWVLPISRETTKL